MTFADIALPSRDRVAAGIVVRPFEAGDAERWDRFVIDCPDATFFHLSAWRDIVERQFRHRTHYLIAERNGAICGVLPLAHTQSPLFGSALVSLPFAVYGGPAALDQAAADALVDRAEHLAATLHVHHLELRNRHARRPAWPRQELYVAFRKPLLPDAESNLSAIPRKQRAMVRKGIANGLVDEIDADVGRFFALYADNVHRHGTPPHSRAYFERLRATFGDACEVLTVVTPDGRPVSGVLSFYFRNEVLPYYAGDAGAARGLAANDFKYWSLMRRACARGCTVFDYGRSKRDSGSFGFKKNWGFEPLPLAYEHRLFRGQRIPQTNPSNPRYRAVIELWRRLPRGLVNRVGPHVIRHLG